MLDLNSVFAVDWPNQVWLMNYFSSYFADHHQFPSVINTFQLIGMPYPVFYGYLFFPLMGGLSLAWNADLTVRIAAVGLFALQYWLVLKLALKSTQDKFCSFCLATLVTWAIYPMTNLYNRGALPEFFATGLLLCSAAIWFFAIEAKVISKRFILCNLFVFLFVLSAGTHPITALYGVCFMALLVCTTLWIDRANLKSLILPLALPIAVGSICLLPWVMVTTHFTPRMVLNASFKRVGYYGRSLDSVYARLMPFPLETKSYKHRLQDDHVTTPHLDTQINFPMLVFFVLCLVGTIQKRERIGKRTMASIVVFGVLALLMIWSSTTSGALDKLGHNFRTIQFAYRLITYINFSLLMGVILFFWKQVEKPVQFRNRLLLGSLLLISFVGLSVKLYHAQQAMVPTEAQLVRSKSFTESLLKMPDSFYGSQAYAITNIFPELDNRQVEAIRNCPFEPLVGKFGDVKTVRVASGIWQTNVQQFPWNRLFDNGNQVVRYEHDNRIAVNLAKDSEIRYECVPDAAWELAHNVSLGVFFTWLIATLGLSAYLVKPVAKATFIESVQPRDVQLPT